MRNPCLPSASLSARAAAKMSATIHRLDPTRPQPSLEPMMQLVASDMNLVNAVILDRMQSDIPLIPELAGHLIDQQGPRGLGELLQRVGVH